MAASRIYRVGCLRPKQNTDSRRLEIRDQDPVGNERAHAELLTDHTCQHTHAVKARCGFLKSEGTTWFVSTQARHLTFPLQIQLLKLRRTWEPKSKRPDYMVQRTQKQTLQKRAQNIYTARNAAPSTCSKVVYENKYFSVVQRVWPLARACTCTHIEDRSGRPASRPKSWYSSITVLHSKADTKPSPSRSSTTRR